MKHQIKLKIGEFSELNQVSVKTLRYYEEIGLLVPFEIDEWTGYRYYKVIQMQTMEKIRTLKRLGFSLEEIKEIIVNKEYSSPTSAMIQEKLEDCKEEIKILQQRKSELIEIQKYLKSIEAMKNYQIKSLPQIIVASHREVIKSYQDLFNLCPNVIGVEMARLGCECPEPGYAYTIDHSGEYKDSDIDIEYCEEVKEMKTDSELIQFKVVPAVKNALCYKHFGPYSKFPESWSKIYAYLEEKGYHVIDHPRFSYIDGIWNKEDENEWLTEIQVPIEEA